MALSFTRGGIPAWKVTRAFPPRASAVFSAISTSRRFTSCRSSARRARMVPRKKPSLGMLLGVLPAAICPMVSTTVSLGATSRLLMVWSSEWMWQRMLMGSMAVSGRAPWLPRPVTSILNISLEARVTPGLAAIVPVGRPVAMAICSPITASTWGYSITPASIIRAAPAAISSAGWKQSLTQPCSSSRCSASSFAAPSSIAVCMSWPQAWFSPGHWLAKGRPLSSSRNRASMSARSRSVFPGRFPCTRATTPPPSCRGSRPKPSSVRETKAAVSGWSRPPSGCWWM